ncbi:MAG: PEP-CTERM sorting domain-containing protein [Pirellulaceae bacterium]
MTIRILSLVAVLATALPAISAPTRYLDSGAFDGDTTSLPFSTVDFDSVLADTAISSGSTFDGLTFTYNSGLDPDELAIIYKPDSVNNYDTTSAPAYLGLDGDELINDGVSFTISNPTGLGFNAFSFQVVSPDQLVFTDDVQVTVSSSTFDITNATFDNELPNGGGFRYFFGVHDPMNSFSSVTISTPTAGGVSGYFGIDDIRFSAATAVPEPGALTFLAFGACLVSIRRRRR